MKRIALLITMFLAALAGPALAQTPDPAPQPGTEVSAVLVWFNTLRDRHDLGVDFPDDEEDLCFCEVYEVEATILRNLDGPPLPLRSKILFVAHALRRPDEQGRAMLMNVRLDRENRLWAGTAWAFVDSDSCIGPTGGGGWSVLEPSSTELTCTRVNRLLP